MPVPRPRRIELLPAAGDEIDLTIDGEPFTIEAEDVQVLRHAPDHLAVAADPYTTVALDTTITPELEAEGLARDVTRAMQDLRKQLGFEIEDRIAVAWTITDDATRAAVTAHRDTIAADLLATTITDDLPSNAEAHDLTVRKETVGKVTLTKA